MSKKRGGTVMQLLACDAAIFNLVPNDRPCRLSLTYRVYSSFDERKVSTVQNRTNSRGFYIWELVGGYKACRGNKERLLHPANEQQISNVEQRRLFGHE